MKKFGGDNSNFARFGGSYSGSSNKFGVDNSSFKRFDQNNNDESDDANIDQRFSPRAPILSTEYFGISTEKTRSSTEIIKSNTDRITQSTDKVTCSTEIFKSSDDILRYIRSHPDFRQVDVETISIVVNAVLAAIASGALLAGGIALTIITWGTASPVILCSTSLLIGTGMTGLSNAISGTINYNFQWSDWGKAVVMSSGLHLLTFGASFGVGSLAGIALLGASLSNTSIKVIGCVAGSLVGSGVRTGSYLIITKLEGKQISAIKIAFESVSGGITGAMAGFLGVKAEMVKFTKAEMVKFTNNLQVKNVFKNGHYLYEYVKLDDVGHVGLIAGKHTANHSGYGLVHILNQHPDVGQALGFTADQINQALSGNSNMLDAIANRLIELLKTNPYGILTKSILQQAEASPVWEIGGRYLKVGLSSHWSTLASKTVIQANLVHVEDVMRKAFSPEELEELVNLLLVIN